MPKLHRFRNLACLLFCFLAVAPAKAQNSETAPSTIRVTFKRAAVASFLVGKRQPQLDQAEDMTLSCPLVQICIDDPDILPHAGRTLTRLADDQLRGRFGQQVIQRSDVQKAEDELKLNKEVDTPRLMAERLGKILNVDAVMIGTVWRYRDRGTVNGMPDSPASVAFAIYLVEAATGRVLWRGLFDETQQALFDNVLNAKKNLKMGLKWLSANELAEYGVREVFNKFPTNVLPGDFSGEQK
ncbi:MAG: hypothetical protein M0036_13720 [Desulfobacteraceae bacterium]|nr:hypothetical protein [Desulfobacteraceae bacterium]